MAIFLALIIIFSTNWAVKNYNITNFDEVLYTLSNSVSSASNEIIYNFIKEKYSNTINNYYYYHDYY